MKLGDTVIMAKEKLTQYLLLPRRKNDKSGYLARAGYSLTNWDRLEADLLELSRGHVRLIRAQALRSGSSSSSGATCAAPIGLYLVSRQSGFGLRKRAKPGS